MEPSITASLDLFAPFGSSPANGKAQLKGSFGNAVLDNIPDYYSQLLTKVWLSCNIYLSLGVAGCEHINATSRTKSSKQSCLWRYSCVPLQSNLSNPPTPPSSLPPTPPPSVQHKLLNGVTPGEELSEGQKDTEPAEEPMGKQWGIWHVFHEYFICNCRVIGF